MAAHDSESAGARPDPGREAHALAASAVLSALGGDAERGLDSAEAARRLKRYGPNLLRHRLLVSAWRILLNQFESIVVWLLAAAAAVAFLLKDWQEGVAIAVVLALNSAIGFFTEIKAVRSVEALRSIATVATKVRRDGAVHELPAQRLVPGDIVIIEGGDVITADLRVIDAANLSADESMLTGESVPVLKGIEPVPDDAVLDERTSMLFKGTAITQGSGEAVVVATGMATELGRIARLAEEAEPEQSPLERRLARLSGQLIWLTLAVVTAIAGVGALSGADLFVMLEASIALAVAAIPEGLPVVATLALARGMWRMARLNALVERLGAVETLGATTVILADKTGTLTENRMTVDRVVTPRGVFPMDREGPFGDDVVEALTVAVLCNGAALREDDPSVGVGDPMEVALLRAGLSAGLARPALLTRMPEVREEAFDPERKMMATLHRAAANSVVTAVKGAPETVLRHAEHIRVSDQAIQPLDAAARQHWAREAERLAERGLRVLALATKEAAQAGGDPYSGLILLGLVGLHDPPRADVPAAIASCGTAGIRVVMMTGDHAATARAIGGDIGLDVGDVVEGRTLRPLDELDTEARERLVRVPIFARVSPSQKLDLVSLYQHRGDIVAMTGDGVNDAPSLKKADIGVAMGRRGTQVAKEAADMVLADDSFPTIVAAIREGRVIFDNIRRFVIYLLSCNLSEILAVGLAVLVGLPLPILPLQILFLNLVNDVFPAFALGAGEGEAGVMKRPPRDPRESILARRHWGAIIGYGALIAAVTLAALVAARELLNVPTREAVTISFLTLAFAQLWHVFNMRGSSSQPLRNEITRNPFVWAALALSVFMLLAAVYVPTLSDVMNITAPDESGWLLVLGLSVVPLFVGQVVKEVAKGLAPGPGGEGP